MAFNPFAGFRKNQKILMVGLIFLCMVSFILCSGMGTENVFTNLLYRLTGGRGQSVATINGRSLTTVQLHEIQNQRKIANIFMHAATDVVLATVNNSLNNLKEQIAKTKGEKQKKELEERRQHAEAILMLLQPRAKATHYFGTGTSFDDLIDFVLWRDEADRLGIWLDRDAVIKQIERLVLGEETGWRKEMAAVAQNKVRDTFPQTSDAQIEEALRQEFRVQIAQMALIGMRGPTHEDPIGFFGMQVRYPLTPAQLWSDYQHKLTQFDVAMLPVRVENYVSAVGEPNELQIKELYEKYRSQPPDPTRDTPGFARPDRIKIGYVYGDPDAEFYKKQAQAATMFQMMPPAFYHAGLPGFGTAIRYVEGKAAWDASMLRNYENDKKDANRSIYFLQVPLHEPDFVLRMYPSFGKPQPEWAAAVIGGAALPGLLAPGPVMYQAAVVIKDEKKMAPAVQEEVERRLPVGGTLVLSGALPGPFAVLSQVKLLETESVYLPFGAVEDHYREVYERQLARQQVKRDMEEVRRELQGARGARREFETRVRIVKERFPGLKVVEPDRFYTRYDVNDAKVLEPLRKSYEQWHDYINYAEGRKGTEHVLKPDDFYRIFFDSSLPYALMGQAAYTVQQWPPEVELPKARPLFADPEQTALLEQWGVNPAAEGLRLNKFWEEAHERFLMWKSEFENSRPYEGLDAVVQTVATGKDVKKITVRDRVVEAWKFQQARAKALAAAEEIARSLLKEQRAGRAYQAQMESEAKKLGAPIITVNRVSEWQPVPRRQRTGEVVIDYEPYKLPKNLLQYPPENISQQLVALNNLTKPLDTVVSVEGKKAGEKKSRDPEVDKVNQKLFDPKLVNTDTKQVQIIVNQPRSVYYVSVVTNATPPDEASFYLAYGHAIARAADQFVWMAHEVAGKEFRDALIKQLRQKNVSDLNREAAVSFTD